MPLELRAAAPEETRAIGEALAGLLGPRDTLLLTGDLGAGKTTLVQGIARGLGVTDHVASPTFVLVREYAGRLPIAHVDVYRLDRVQDVVDLELDELGGADRVLVVEWGDAVEELLPGDRLRIDLRIEDPRTEVRRLGLIPEGRAWTDRFDDLAASLERWKATAA